MREVEPEVPNKDSGLSLVVSAGPEGRETPRDHHKEHHSEAPEITLWLGVVSSHNLWAHELHSSNLPAPCTAQTSKLTGKTKVDDLYVKVVSSIAGEHDVVWLDIHVDDLQSVHEAESLEDLPRDDFALVLIQLERFMGDRVKEVTASKVLRDDATLIDPLEVFNNIHDKLTVREFPQQGHLRGCSVPKIIIFGILELTETLSLANSSILIITLHRNKYFHDDWEVP